MRVPIIQVDAFAARGLGGNPAAVMVLPTYPDDATLQGLAHKNNLAETAFLVRDNADWHVRWFTPTVEVPRADTPPWPAHGLSWNGSIPGSIVSFFTP